MDMPSGASISHDPSSTAAFAALPDVAFATRGKRPLRAVVIGGGTGAPVSIRTLLSMGFKTSVVVAMADDGGSTGGLRAEMGATPPGDIRKCLTAMAGDPNDPMTQAFKMRFSFAENHTLGNLMLSALERTSGSFPYAINECEKILATRGHVYCSTLEPVTLSATTVEGARIEGQAKACHSAAPLRAITLCSEVPVTAYPPAIDALYDADVIVLGPGSLFTSILPNIVVPGIAKAVCDSKALVVFICNLADMQGETRGLSAFEHYQALVAHGLESALDAMIVQKNLPKNLVGARGEEILPVRLTDADRRAITACGTRLFEGDLVDAKRPTWHDPQKLQHMFAEVIGTCLSPRM